MAGDSRQADVRAFVLALNAGTASDAKAGLRVFKGRPVDSLAQSYGPDFARALAATTPGVWTAQAARDGGPVASQAGWRAMRLEAITPPKPASFETLRGVVLQDWTDATLAAQRSASVAALAKKYSITFAPVAP